MKPVLQDWRPAIRGIVRAPGFAATMVLTLALGIGATSAILAVARSTFLRPLPFSDEGRLLRLLDVRTMEGGGASEVAVSARTFFAVRERVRSFERVCAQRFQRLSLQGAADRQSVIAIAVSPGWLATLGVRPALGRGFTVEEEREGSASRVAIVSQRLWRQRLGGDPAAIGRRILLAGESFAVIGVMPAGFDFPYDADLWRPWLFDRQDGRQHILNVQARLRPGVTVAQAAAELTALSRTLEHEFPESNRGFSTICRPVRATLIEEDGRLVLLLLFAVAAVLLLAAANMAALTLARYLGGLRDIAVRAALGASAMVRVRPLLFETLLLTLLGGLAGLALTVPAAPLLQRLVPAALETVGARTRADGWVALATVGISLAVGLGIGLGAAEILRRQDLRAALAHGSRAGRDSGVERTLRRLAVAEIALALVLLAGATEMISGLRRQVGRDLGFDPEGLVTFQAALPEERYTDPGPRIAFVEQAVARLQALPGVAGAGVVNVFPLAAGNRIVPFAIGGREVIPERAPVVNHRIVSPGYFAAMRIPLLRGRFFDARDGRQAEPVVLVSRSMVQRYWPAEDAIGRRVRILVPGQDSPWRTVIGVVGDVVQPLIDSPVAETWYVPYAQNGEVSNAWSVLQVPFAVRLARPGSASVREIESAVSEVDPGVAVFGTLPAGVAYRAALAPRRLATMLSACFGAFGLLLSLLGVYGMASYAVSRRRREIAVRRALGATEQRVVVMMVGEGLRLGAYGIALGLLGTIAGIHALGALFAGMGSPSLGQLALAALLLLLASTLACGVPAARATRDEIAAVLGAEG